MLRGIALERCRMLNRAPCRKCGSTDFGIWTSSTTSKIHQYCRQCRRSRATTYSQQKEANGGSHTRRQWLEKLAQYNNCPRCRVRWEDIPPRPDLRYKHVWTKDHIIPLSLGGTDDIQNIQPLCYRCNSSKCNR